MWLLDNGAWLGLGVGLALMVALFVAVLPLVRPLGPLESVQGAVNSLGVTASRTRGPTRWARIDVEGRSISLRMTDGEPCMVGQPVSLLKRRTRLGYRYAFTLKGCAG